MNARADYLDDHIDRLMRFSDRLRSLLVQCGHPLAPAQLARDFTFSSGEQRATAQTFSNWLNGVQLPRTHTLDALAQWLHVTPDYLVNGVAVLQFKQAPAATDDEHKLLDHFRKMDNCGRRMVLAMAATAVKLKAGAA